MDRQRSPKPNWVWVSFSSTPIAGRTAAQPHFNTKQVPRETASARRFAPVIGQIRSDPLPPQMPFPVNQVRRGILHNQQRHPGNMPAPMAKGDAQQV